MRAVGKAKRCPRCETWKPLEKFTRDSSRRDGLCYLCKKCKRQDTKHYYLNHPEAMKRNQTLYRKRHVDLANARSRRWNHNHRTTEVNRLLEVYGSVCHLCGKVIALKDFSIDHIVPLSLGGSDIFSNTKPAHRSCNSSKGNRVALEYAEQEG